MTINIRTENPLSDDGLLLINGSESALRAVYSVDECYSFSPAELAAPNIQFLVARCDARAVGCVALVDQGTYAEVKRLFVLPEARGLGMARALMQALEDAARDIGLGIVRLETGPALDGAVALYRALGYVERSKFGDYGDCGASLFLEKRVGVSVTLGRHISV